MDFIDVCVCVYSEGKWAAAMVVYMVWAASMVVHLWAVMAGKWVASMTSSMV